MRTCNHLVALAGDTIYYIIAAILPFGITHITLQTCNLDSNNPRDLLAGAFPNIGARLLCGKMTVSLMSEAVHGY